MALKSTVRRHLGLTLLEVLVATAATLVVIALVVSAMGGFERDQAVRLKITELQGTARQALEFVEFDLRHASLGTSSGAVWTASAGARVSRPAIQVFTAVPGGADAVIQDAKADTDAVLVVEAVPGSTGRSVTVGPLATSVGGFRVADASGFADGDRVLLGDYGNAAWGQVESRVASEGDNRLTLANQSVNVLPGQPVPVLGAGAAVRRARARLYYVTTRDELVRLELAVPYAPSMGSHVISREVVGQGFENMQVDCQLDDFNAGVVSCSDPANPAPVLQGGDPITGEAAAAFGTFAAGGGPRLDSINIARLRTLSIHVSVRSRTPLRDSRGDDTIPLLGARGTAVALGAGSAGAVDASDVFARRSYRIVAGVRNTSMGAL